MQKVVHELPKILQLSLARIIEMENNDVPMTFLDPAVESILAQEGQHTAWLVLTKEDKNSSTPSTRIFSKKRMMNSLWDSSSSILPL